MTTNFSHITHHFQKNPENGTFHVGRVTPIIRLSSSGRALFLQQGRVLDEGGNPIKDQDLPGWFYEEVAKTTDQAMAESGFRTRPTPPSAVVEPTKLPGITASPEAKVEARDVVTALKSASRKE